MARVKFTFVAVLAAILLPALTAQSATVTFHFNGTDGVTTSLWWDQGGWGSVNNNTGAEPGVVKLSKPNVDWYFPAALFKPDLPANLAGATVNYATLTLRESWGNTIYNNVEAHRVTQAWTPGTGLATDRWGTMDNGAGKYFSNFDATAYGADKGLAWDGSVQSKWDIRNATWAFGPGMGMDASVIGVGNGVGAAPDKDWDLTSWVQGVAAGTYANHGFALWGANMVLAGAAENTLELRTRTNPGTGWVDVAGTGLVIDYTPVPEPAAISLLGVAFLPLLRRRSR